MGVSQTREHNVYIVGAERMTNELLFYYLEQSTDPFLNCSLNKSFSHLSALKKTDKRSLVLWDCHGVEELILWKKLDNIFTTIPLSCYLACFNARSGLTIDEMALNYGVRGIFYENDPLSNLIKGIKAILNGELWFSRNILSSSLSNFVQNNNSHLPPDSSVAILTKREKEILRLVASGVSNDGIAEKLCISPFTVKTHVRNIYRKIEVPSRVQAIFWVADNHLLLKK